MQSPLAIILRISVLFGCLVLLPLLAAGGLSAPAKMLSLAQTRIISPITNQPLLAPRMIQVELPDDALRYRATGSPAELAWDESEETEVAEAMPVGYEEIKTPTHDPVPPGAAAPWHQLTSSALPASPIPADDQVFERGERVDRPAAFTVSGIESRLRELGAIDVRFEPWGSSGQLFRCSTIFSVAESGEVHRYFQAIGPNPNQAAQEVLDQVTASIR